MGAVGAPQPAAADGAPSPFSSNQDIFEVDAEGRVVAMLSPDGTRCAGKRMESDGTAADYNLINRFDVF